MRRISFVLHREDIKSPLRKPGGAAQVFADHFAEVVALLAVHSSLGGFHLAGGSGFDLDETQYVSVPADEINFAVMPGRAEVPGYHNVPATAKIEIGVFLAAPAGAEVGWTIFASFRRNAVEQAQDCLSYSPRGHRLRLVDGEIFVCDAGHTRIVIPNEVLTHVSVS